MSREEYGGVQAAYYDSYFTGVPGDVEFYLEVARGSGALGVLELGCGTGRTLLPIAAAGIASVGLERAPEVLAMCAAKVAAAGLAEQVELVSADMREFSLDRQFSLVIAPYRTFQHLLTIQDQKAALDCIYRHLVPGGLFVLNVFDPLRDLAQRAWEEGEGVESEKDAEFVDPNSGQVVEVWFKRTYDLLQQLLLQEFTFRRLTDDGPVDESATLTMRYAHRYEMAHLLEAQSFHIKGLYGGFAGQPYRGYGEQIWIAERS